MGPVPDLKVNAHCVRFCWVGREGGGGLNSMVYDEGRYLHLRHIIINIDTRRQDSAAMHFSTGYSISLTKDCISDHLCSAQTVTRIGLLKEIPRIGVQIPCLS